MAAERSRVGYPSTIDSPPNFEEGQYRPRIEDSYLE